MVSCPFVLLVIVRGHVWLES